MVDLCLNRTYSSKMSLFNSNKNLLFFIVRQTKSDDYKLCILVNCAVIKKS